MEHESEFGEPENEAAVDEVSEPEVNATDDGIDASIQPDSGEGADASASDAFADVDVKVLNLSDLLSMRGQDDMLTHLLETISNEVPTRSLVEGAIEHPHPTLRVLALKRILREAYEHGAIPEEFQRMAEESGNAAAGIFGEDQVTATLLAYLDPDGVASRTVAWHKDWTHSKESVAGRVSGEEYIPEDQNFDQDEAAYGASAYVARMLVRRIRDVNNYVGMLRHSGVIMHPEHVEQIIGGFEMLERHVASLVGYPQTIICPVPALEFMPLQASPGCPEMSESGSTEDAVNAQGAFVEYMKQQAERYDAEVQRFAEAVAAKITEGNLDPNTAAEQVKVEFEAQGSCLFPERDESASADASRVFANADFTA